MSTGIRSTIFRTLKKHVAVNPEHSDSNLKYGAYRPPPGSFTEKYEPEPGPADKLSKNYYYTRDVRRDYPRTTVYSQEDVATLMLATAPEPQKAIDSKESLEAVKATPPNLTEALSKVEAFTPANCTQFLPPYPRKRYRYVFSEENYQVEAGVYWPVYLVK